MFGFVICNLVASFQVKKPAMEKVQTLNHYEEVYSLPDLSHMLLPSENFSSVGLHQSNLTYTTSPNHIINQDIETSNVDLLNTPFLNAQECESCTQSRDISDVNLNEPSSSTTEEEFLHRLNLFKCDKSSHPVSITLKKPNTRHAAKLKCAKRNTTKFSSTTEKTIKKAIKPNRKTSHVKTGGGQQRKSTKKSKLKQKASTLLAKSVTRVDKQRFDEVTSFQSNDDTGSDAVAGICRPCRWAFSSKEEKVKHFSSIRHIITVESKQGTNYQALKEEASAFGEIKCPATCTACDESFMNKRDFLVHHRRHAEMRPFHCVRCSAKFYRRCDLLNHLREHLGGNYHFHCKECNRSLRTKGMLDAHMVSKHGHADTRSRNFKCTECNIAFMTKTAVDKHMKTHTGHSVVNCPICCRGFADKFSLKCHQRLHSGEMAFKCDKCDYRSRTKQLLLRHQRCHGDNKSFKCTTCSFVCNSSSGLKRHLVQHSGTKPFKCPYCNYRSTNIENMRKHIKKVKKHAGLKIYPCQLCSFSCDVGADFIKHVKQQHFPGLDEDTASATKLAGLIVSEKDAASKESFAFTSQSNSLSAHTLPPLQAVLDPLPEVQAIDMLLLGNLPTTSHQQDRSNFDGDTDASSRIFDDCIATTQVSNNSDLTTVDGLNEDLLNAIIKIPNLQQVILPAADCNAPVTLVIGSDQVAYDVIEEDGAAVLQNTNDVRLKGMLQQPPQACFSENNILSTSSSGHQHYIISSSGIRSYKKD